MTDARSGLVALTRDFLTFSGRRLWPVAALMIAGAVAEGFGLLLIVPLAAIAVGEETRLPDWVAGIVDAIPSDQRLLACAALFLAAMAARSLLLLARDTLRARLGADYQSSLRLRSASTLAGKPWAESGQVGQTAMQSLLLNDVPRAAQGVDYGLEFVLSAILLLVQLALAAFLSPGLTLFAVVVLAPAFLFQKLLTRRLVSTGEAYVQSVESSTGVGMMLQAGLKSAAAQGTIPQFLAEYGTSLRRLAGHVGRYARDLATSRQVSAFTTAVSAVLLLLVGARVLDLPFPVLAASLILFARMAAPAVTLTQSAQLAISYAPSFAAIGRRLGPLGPPEVQELAARRVSPLAWSVLELRGAGYRHTSGRGVEALSLEIARGEWIGLSGPSGGGKTTMIDLVAALYAPGEGRIVLDGKELAGTTLDRWRAGLAYVGQDGLVFADTVAANLTVGGDPIDDTEMWSVLDSVGLGDRIRAFAGGLDHSLGTHGGALSGGERQRLLLARALIRRPVMLILDESTAALDPESEGLVLDAFRRLDSRPAAILVAHRESTLAHCDRRFVIQHGLVKEGEAPR